MGDKYQENWVHYLPWALLGLRSSFHSDLGTSPTEMTFGKSVQLPGTILADPDEVKGLDDISVDALLRRLQIKDNRMAVPPAVNKKNTKIETLPDSVSHIYARQHNVKGLSEKYLGPLPVLSRPNRSTIEVKVGLNKDGSQRREVRHISDVKVAHLRDGATIAERPKRGRPSSNASKPVESETMSSSPPEAPDTSAPPTHDEQAGNSNSRPVRSTRNPVPLYVDSIDFNGPPPFRGFPELRTWSASASELDSINASIGSRRA